MIVIANSHPEWMTTCGEQYGIKEPLNVMKPEVTEFVQTLYTEISNLYMNTSNNHHRIDTTNNYHQQSMANNDIEAMIDPPDQTSNQQHWIHIGGDEVHTACWNMFHQVDMINYFNERNITLSSDLGKQLLHLFVTELSNFVIKTLKHRPVCWQELFDNREVQQQPTNDSPSDALLPLNTVIDVWMFWSYWNTMQSATREGYDVIVSYCWYLDYLDKTWIDFYNCDITDGANNYQHKVLGGHASLWSERIDRNNFFQLLYPRTSAMAENLWSGKDMTVGSIKKLSTLSRLNRFRCLMMLQMNIPVTPISPGGTCTEIIQKPISLVPNEAWLQGFSGPYEDP
jgi:Glycosyl hydrolase family 20, catalytic domain